MREGHGQDPVGQRRGFSTGALESLGLVYTVGAVRHIVEVDE